LSFMKREFSSVYLALYLVLGCIVFRLLSSHYPELIPNISPLMAISFVGAMYLPARWAWLVGPSTLLVTDVAFVELNKHAGSPMFSWWTLISLVIYAAAGGLGILISKRKTFTKIIAGSLSLSLLFYVVANTFAWAGGAAMAGDPGYAQTLAGWWQANTVGLPGYVPTWTFLRNAMAGDLFFVFVLLLVLDRGFLFAQAPEKTSARMA
jgi:hypothetical protein